MNKIIFTLIGVAIACGIFFTVKWGVSPRSLKEINPSYFDKNEEIGAVVFRKIIPHWNDRNIIVLGGSPSIHDYSDIWVGLLKTAKAGGGRWDALLVVDDSSALDQFPGAKKISAASEMDTVVKMASDIAKEGKKVVVVVPSQFVDNTFAYHIVSALEEASGMPILSIAQQGFVVNPQHMDRLTPKCETTSETPIGISLGCAGKSVSEKYFRKSLDPKRTVAVMEEYGLAEYILFIHQPHGP